MKFVKVMSLDKRSKKNMEQIKNLCYNEERRGNNDVSDTLSQLNLNKETINQGRKYANSS